MGLGWGSGRKSRKETVCSVFWEVGEFIWLRPLSSPQRGVNAISSVQSLSRVRLFATPWTAARQASLFSTNSRSLLKLMSIESVMPSNHLIFCRPLLLLPSIFSNIRVFSNDLLFTSGGQSMRASVSVLPMNIQGWFPLGLTGLISLQSKELSRVFSSTTIRKHQFFGTSDHDHWKNHNFDWGHLSENWGLCLLTCCLGLS